MVTIATPQAPVQPHLLVPSLGHEPCVRFAVAVLGLVAALSLCGLMGLPVAPTAVVIGMTGSLAGRRLGPADGALIGLVGWALYTGFVVHRYGELSFAPADLEDLVAFVAMVPAAAGMLRLLTTHRRRGAAH